MSPVLAVVLSVAIGIASLPIIGLLLWAYHLWYERGTSILMASWKPCVQGGYLEYWRVRGWWRRERVRIAVDSEEWHRWLAARPKGKRHGFQVNFTIRREDAMGMTTFETETYSCYKVLCKGRYLYWQATKKSKWFGGSKVRTVHLGTSDNVTRGRLLAAGDTFAWDIQQGEEGLRRRRRVRTRPAAVE